jgi:hypothetical protein
MIENNVTITGAEICRLCTDAVPKVPLKEYIASISVYSAGGPPASAGTIPFNNPVIVGAFCLIAVLIGVILVCFVHLHTLKKKE